MDKFAKSLFVCVGSVAKYQPFDEDDSGSDVPDAAKAGDDVSASSPVPYSCEQCGHRGSVAPVAQNKVGRNPAAAPPGYCSTRWNLPLRFLGLSLNPIPSSLSV